MHGGAARAAYWLHTGLNAMASRPGDSDPVHSAMLVASRQTQDEAVLQYRAGGSLPHRVARRVRRWRLYLELSNALRGRSDGYESFSTDCSAHGDRLAEALPPCDVVNLHWVSGLLDYERFLPAVCAKIPVVWTLHDMNPLTGGCHYDDDCGRHFRGCGMCPQLCLPGPTDLSAKVWQRKKRIFDALPADRLTIVSPSRWLAEQARSSPLLSRFETLVIPCGLDLSVFAPLGRDLCRAALGIPMDRKVLLFVAQSTAIRRKGFALLRDLLRQMPNDRVFLLSVGAGDARINADIPSLALGSVENDRLLALAYGAADLFVIPSLQDNLPNTVVEAMACGTPVAGFAVGGVPELVRPGETGALARRGDVAALASVIHQLLDDEPTRQAISRNCRRIALQEYSQPIQAARYATLYTRLCANTSSARKANSPSIMPAAGAA